MKRSGAELRRLNELINERRGAEMKDIQELIKYAAVEIANAVAKIF